MELPGIGGKISELVMEIAWNKCDGICVDVHVERVCNRLKWAKGNPTETEKQLIKWLPKEYWREINYLFVGFGQQICKSEPKCNICLNHKICPFSKWKNKDIEDTDIYNL